MIGNRILAGVLGLLLAGPTMAQIYQWTDDDGQMHFGENPPANVDAQRVEGPAHPRPADGDDEDGAEAHPEAAEDTEEPVEQQEEPDAASDDDAEMDEMLAEACEDMRHNADVYGDESVRRVQDPDGEVSIITPEEREERLDEAETFLDEHC